VHDWGQLGPGVGGGVLPSHKAGVFHFTFFLYVRYIQNIDCAFHASCTSVYSTTVLGASRNGHIAAMEGREGRSARAHGGPRMQMAAPRPTAAPRLVVVLRRMACRCDYASRRSRPP
jgi:hypothetical protein